MRPRLKKIRQEAGISAQKVADAIGVSVQTVFNWESGNVYPQRRRMILVADYLKQQGAIDPGMPPSLLFEPEPSDEREMDFFRNGIDGMAAASG